MSVRFQIIEGNWVFPSNYVDSSIVTGTFAFSRYRDYAVVSGKSWIKAVEAATFIDSARVTGRSFASAIESRTYAPDADTITGIAIISALEGREFPADTDVVTGIASILSVEYAEFSDAATAVGVGDAFQSTLDGDAVTGIADPSATDIATFVDSVAAIGIASISASVEQLIYGDSNTATGIAEISAVENAQYVDQSSSYAIGIGSALVSFGVSDAATHTSIGVPSADDIAQYVDNETASTTGSGAAIDSFLPVDADWAIGIAAPEAVETRLPAIAFVAATTATVNATSLTLNVPVGTASGDVLIAAIHQNNTVNAVAAPVGWSVLAHADSASGGMTVLYRAAGGSEPASYNFTVASSSRLTGSMVAYRNADTAGIGYVFSTATGSSTSITASSIITTSGNNMLVGAFGNKNNQNHTPDAGMTERSDTSQAMSSLEMADEMRNATGATGTRTATISASAGWVAILLTLRQP